MSKILIRSLKTAFLKRCNLVQWDLRWILLLGTLIRFLLIPFVAHPFDINSWYKYCIGILEHGIDITTILSSVRPFWFLTLIPVAYTYGFLSRLTGLHTLSIEHLPSLFNPQYNITFVPDPAFNLLVKLPMLITDIATTFFLYKLVNQFFGGEKAKLASLLFFLNPICIWMSAAWGQYESIPTFFTILSLYFLINKREVSSALSLVIATLFKVYPGVFFLPTSIYLLKKSDKRSLLKYLLAFFLPLLIFFSMSGGSLVNTFFEVSHVYSTSSPLRIFGFGLTYWSISTLFPLNPIIWGPISTLLMMLLLSLSLYFISRLKFDILSRDLTKSIFVLFTAGVLSHRYVAETRFVWVLPFLTFMFIEETISKKAYFFLSLTAFLYTQKNFPYYLLPIATINKEILKPLFAFATPFGKIVEEALLPTPLSAAVLAILGTLFAIVMLITYVKIIKKEGIQKNLT